MFSQVLSSGFRRALLMATIALLLPTVSLAQSKQEYSQKVSPGSPQGMLELAMYYYNNDDVTGRAEEAFQRLLTKSNEQTPQYETGQYYLAAFYQRKFYLQLAKGQRDWNTLKQAAIEYRKYTDRFYTQGKHTWLSDSFFNLAIVNLQLNLPYKAFEELSKMKNAAALDPSVYIYQVVWSPQSQSVIDASLPSARLADFTASVAGSKGYYFESAVLQIQKWCQSQR